jgi:hypothetical protein
MQGSCADPNTLNIAANVNVLKSDFGQVTPENSMKASSEGALAAQKANHSGRVTIVGVNRTYVLHLSFGGLELDV